MRMAMWLLLALNGLAAAVLLAGVSVPPRSVVELTVPSPSAKPLQLLSELPALPPRLDMPPVDSGVMPGMPGEGATAAPETAGIQAPVAGPQIAVPAPPPVAESPVQAAPVAGSSPTTQPAAPVEAQPAQASAPAVPEPPANALVAPVTTDQPAPDSPTCYRTAALSGDTYEAAGRALRAADLGEPTLQPQDRARPRYWVYWAGAADELAGIEERLKVAGVRDWYRLRAADGMPRISLGVYGQADGARNRQRELAGKAIQAQISSRYPPQAKLRWTVLASPALVEAAKDRLQGQGVRLEPCQ